MEDLLGLVHKEIDRRRTLDADAQKRKEQIRREYQPLHPELYAFQVNEELDKIKGISRFLLEQVFIGKFQTNMFSVEIFQ